MMRWRAVLSIALVCAVLAGCAPKSDDDNQRGGFYGGITGGMHP